MDTTETKQKQKREATAMICLECGKRFKRRIGPRTFEVRCPKCHGYDTDLDYKRGIA